MNGGAFHLLGAVIAGGLSRRMGDRDKLWIELGGEPLVARAARRLAAQTGDVVLNVNRPDARLETLGWPVVPDLEQNFQGPLAGLLAVLTWARDHAPGVTHLVSVSADSPFFPGDLGERLKTSVNDRREEIAIAFCDDCPQPVFGLWPVACLPSLEQFLAETGSLKVMGFVRSRSWRRVDFEPGEPHAFFNINTPEDHEMALSFIEQQATQP